MRTREREREKERGERGDRGERGEREGLKNYLEFDKNIIDRVSVSPLFSICAFIRKFPANIVKRSRGKTYFNK